MVAVALVVALWRRPELSPVVVLVAALTIEQFPFTTGQPGAMSPGVTPSDYTDRLPFFHGLGGVHVSPADLLVLTLLLIWLLKRGTSQTVATSPDLRSRTRSARCWSRWESGWSSARPTTARSALRSPRCGRTSTSRSRIWWRRSSRPASRSFASPCGRLVLGSGFKAAQALYSFLHVRNQIPRPDFIVGHEEALFFALFIILTLVAVALPDPGPAPDDRDDAAPARLHGRPRQQPGARRG